MLVLTRKPREAIVIGGTGSTGREFTITVLEIKGGKVKLGFDGDPSIKVQRSEVWTKKRAGDRPDDHFEDFGAPKVL